MKRITLAVLTAITLCQSPAALSQRDADQEGFTFALIGDLPYTAAQETTFAAMLQELDREKLAFVVHDGDFKGGSSLCDDNIFLRRLAEFQNSRHPFVYVPGDNEWTDCWRPKAGGYDPIERLNKLRALFFQGNTSLGRHTLRLTRQSENPAYAKFVENVRWRRGGVVFLGLNVPGSNNNFGRTPTMDAEYRERNAANLAWLQEGFAYARQHGALGVMLVIQADPGFELKSDDPRRTGYNDFLNALYSETRAFGKPVVLVHGDSHYFRIDKPLVNPSTREHLDNFTRLETFGNPDVHWVRVRVEPRNPNLFLFQEGRPRQQMETD